MDSPVRIAQIIGKATLGGVDIAVMNYYRHIDRSKIQFDFFMDGLGKSPIDDEIIALGGRIYKLTPYEESMKTNLRQFREILKQNSYKIVHCHMNTLSVFWLREAKYANIPIRIAHSHSTAHWGEGKRTVMKYALRPFSRVYPTHYCACGEYAGRWLFGKRACKVGKVSIMHNAIDLNKFKFDAEARGRVRKTLGVNDKFVVGHVGRFTYQKNHKMLIKTFLSIYKQNPNAVLMLIGEGELKYKIEQLVSELGLSRAVLFLGVRKDVNELYQAMDVFVMPSWYEGFGIVALEAQTAGLPCVISNQVPIEAVLTDTCTRMPLSNGAGKWAEAVLRNVGFYADRSDGIIINDYNIVDGAKKLENLYERAVHEC